MLFNQPKIKIAIVDDHNLFRKGLIKLINLGDTHHRYIILFEAENGNDLKEKIDKKNTPHIILMDIDMPGMDGFATVEWLSQYYPDIRVLIISMHESEEKIMRMIRMNVKGYLSKDIEVEDIHRALEAISSNGLYYSDTASDAIHQNLNDEGKQGKNIQMNERTREFLNLVCTELTYQQIADQMNLSPKTIDGYRETLFQRFGIKSRVGLAMYAVRNGLVQL